MKTPLAWLQLAHEKTRLAVALAGIGFADMLMFVQLGFQAALFDSNLRLPSNLDADIVLLNSQTKAILSIQSFSSRRLYQSLSVPGVQSVSPLYLSFALWKNPINRQTRQLMVIGMNPEDQVLNLPGVAENINKIKLPDTYLFDDQSRAEFGPVAQLINEGKNVTTEVNERKITVEGLFTLGASFSADGNVITSDINFIRLFKRNKGLIDLGLVKVEPGTDVNQIVSQLKQKFPEDIRVLTKEEFKDFEKQYWQNSTSIGFVFSLGTAIGFVVGIVIVYQILYTGV
ncbi:MAG: ABC transporter, partial [Cyanobacteria bacterium J083]